MNIKRIELLAVVSVAIATIAIAASMMAPQKAGAHTSDLGFKWFNNGYDYENVEIYGISNSWDVSSGLWDWYWNSLLWVNSASGFKEITYQEGDFGTTAPLGRAQVYSNTGTCMTDDTNFPGACTKNYPYQATTAVLLLNTNCTTQSCIAARPIAARHELGHAFGLRHYSETGCEGILMDRGACSPHASSVTAHDAELVDLLY